MFRADDPEPCAPAWAGRPNPEENNLGRCAGRRLTQPRRCRAQSRFPDHLLDQLETPKLAPDLGDQTRRQGAAVTGAQLGQALRRIRPQRQEIPNALGHQKALDAVDVGCALTDQTLAFAGPAPAILVLNGGNVRRPAGVVLRRASGPPTRMAGHEFTSALLPENHSLW